MDGANEQTRFQRAVNLYRDGFINMPRWAKSLWMIILIKLFVMFFVFKLFFFRDTLKNNYPTTHERAEHVIEQITNTTINDGTR